MLISLLHLRKLNWITITLNRSSYYNSVITWKKSEMLFQKKICQVDRGFVTFCTTQNTMSTDLH